MKYKINECKKKIKILRLLRIRDETHRFMFMMPWFKKHEHLPINEIRTKLWRLCSYYVDNNLDGLNKMTSLNHNKITGKYAYYEEVFDSFFEKGLPRERIALKWLKSKLKSAEFNGNLRYELECQGIDITDKDERIGISVKGGNFKNSKSYLRHVQQLVDNKFDKNVILFVNEKTKNVEHEIIDI